MENSTYTICDKCIKYEQGLWKKNLNNHIYTNPNLNPDSSFNKKFISKIKDQEHKYREYVGGNYSNKFMILNYQNLFMYKSSCSWIDESTTVEVLNTLFIKEPFYIYHTILENITLKYMQSNKSSDLRIANTNKKINKIYCSKDRIIENKCKNLKKYLCFSANKKGSKDSKDSKTLFCKKHQIIANKIGCINILKCGCRCRNFKIKNQEYCKNCIYQCVPYHQSILKEDHINNYIKSDGIKNWAKDLIIQMDQLNICNEKKSYLFSNLPAEIIIRIISYLNPNDIIRLYKIKIPWINNVIEQSLFSKYYYSRMKEIYTNVYQRTKINIIKTLKYIENTFNIRNSKSIYDYAIFVYIYRIIALKYKNLKKNYYNKVFKCHEKNIKKWKLGDADPLYQTNKPENSPIVDLYYVDDFDDIDDIDDNDNLYPDKIYYYKMDMVTYGKSKDYLFEFEDEKLMNHQKIITDDETENIYVFNISNNCWLKIEDIENHTNNKRYTKHMYIDKPERILAIKQTNEYLKEINKKYKTNMQYLFKKYTNITDSYFNGIEMSYNIFNDTTYQFDKPIEYHFKILSIEWLIDDKFKKKIINEIDNLLDNLI